MKSLILGDHHHHCHCATWHDTMDGKVMIAQTLARGTQWDFNLAAMADGVNTFSSPVFGNGTCSTRGAISNLTLQNTTLIMTDFVSQAVDHF